MLEIQKRSSLASKSSLKLFWPKYMAPWTTDPSFLHRPFLIFFLLPFWRAVRSYRPHSEARDFIWGDDCSHGFHRRSPSWDFPGLSSAVRQIPRDLSTAPHYISLWPLSLSDKRHWHDTRGKWPLTRNPDRNW